MPLTDTAIRKAKPGVKPCKLSDGSGLYLLLNPTGSKLWRLKYRVQGREKLLALGAYPAVSLFEARKHREEAREQLRQGIDPNVARRAKNLADAEERTVAADTFEAVAREWMARRLSHDGISEATAGKDRWRLETYLFPTIGARPITAITARELRDVLRQVEETGKLETASRTKINAGQVFRWAVLEGRADSDPTATLRGLFATPKHTHRAALTDPVRIGELLRAIDGYTGQFTTLCALKLAPLVFLRPGELRKGEWCEIDLVGSIWRIPAERMKMKASHLVPLSTQAVDVLRDLRELTGSGVLMFPAIGSSGKPMSENTVNLALRRLGYGKDEMSGHGFRAMAATRLNEMGWNADAIERQLAHAESNKVRAAYTHAAQYLDERTRMMQAWADYLDALRAVANVMPIRNIV